MKFILGRKCEMTQHYSANGAVVSATVVQAGPCVVTQVKTQEKDGYNAIQFGYGTKKRVSKPLQGHSKNLVSENPKRGFALLKEMRLPSVVSDVKRGDVIDVSSFSSGDKVECIGWSKGRGFAGVVKRHHFHGHPTTHGHKDQTRMPGSIGSGGVQHVFKGVRMAGRMGTDQVTVKGLEIIAVDTEKNQLVVRGALPGARNGFIIISSPEGSMAFKKPGATEEQPIQHAVEEKPEQSETGNE